MTTSNQVKISVSLRHDYDAVDGSIQRYYMIECEEVDSAGHELGHGISHGFITVDSDSDLCRLRDALTVFIESRGIEHPGKKTT